MKSLIFILTQWALISANLAQLEAKSDITVEERCAQLSM